MNATETAIKAVAAPTRREILRLCLDGERTAGELVANFDVTWPAVSQHIKVLRQAGLLDERRQGTKRFYRVRPDGVAALRASLQWLWDDSLLRLRDVVEADYEQARRDRAARRARRPRGRA